MILEVVLGCLLLNFAHSISQHPILIVVSYDAFKYDFFSTKDVPHMNRIRKVGTHADYLINVFPTKTFPNHHSIATGLYPEIHGVIGNTYFDTTTNDVVHIGPDMFQFNANVVPIWRMNEDAAQGRYSGVMMWPGGCYSYQRKNISHCQAYDPTLDWYKRIDKVIEWIKDPSKPANLILVYFEEPDTHGHIYGTNSRQVNDLISKLDEITYYLEQQLQLNKLSDIANVIHLSDHGMVNVRPPNLINVTQYLTPNTYYLAGSSPVLQFIPKKGFENEIYQKLKRGSQENGHFKVYKKDDYLQRWHYKNNPRSPPILVLADVGYALDDLIIASRKYAQKYNLTITNTTEVGVHGYDYVEEQMRPFFMARGPRIKPNHKVAPFNTVDLLSLFCEILQIEAPKTNGTKANILDILSQVGGKYTSSTLLLIIAGGIFIALFFIGCAALITVMIIKRQQSKVTTAALNKRVPEAFQYYYHEARHLLEPEDA